MKYIKIVLDTPYCGTREEIYEEYDDDVGDSTIDQIVEDYNYSHAEEFTHCINGWDGDVSDDELDEYFQDCSGTWEEITKEEFDENQ